MSVRRDSSKAKPEKPIKWHKKSGAITIRARFKSTVPRPRGICVCVCPGNQTSRHIPSVGCSFFRHQQQPPLPACTRSHLLTINLPTKWLKKGSLPTVEHLISELRSTKISNKKYYFKRIFFKL